MVEHDFCNGPRDMIACIPVAAPVQRGRASNGRLDEHAPRVRQLRVIREMLRMLDTVTTAGQHHLMNKVIAFVEGQVEQVAANASGASRAALAELMAQLRNDAHGLVPDAARFTRHTESLIDLLVAGGVSPGDR
ncbi:MAG TPA: hypothetical protein VHO67_13475 [Polyangia bacterium]|nr:hypothetical protein [Polyangia bacterium]